MSLPSLNPDKPDAKVTSPAPIDWEAGDEADIAPRKPASADDDLPHQHPIDPALIFLVLVGVTVLGLGGIAPDIRYTLLWSVLIIAGILAILFDHLEVEIPNANDMLWGIGFGALIGVPLMLIAAAQLQRTTLAMFENSAPAFVFQSLALAMPAGETLFFRGALQPTRGLLFTAIAGSVWSVILFFPQLHVTEVPLVAAVIGFAFVVINFAYSYIKLRFGLFAAWTCQMTINLLLLFAVRFF